MEELHAKYKELLGKEVPNNKKSDEDWIKSKIEEAENSESKPTNDTYVMKVTHLAWGANGKNHFYADKKPLINAKEMGKYAGLLKDWLKAGWIEKGSYK